MLRSGEISITVFILFSRQSMAYRNSYHMRHRDRPDGNMTSSIGFLHFTCGNLLADSHHLLTTSTLSKQVVTPSRTTTAQTYRKGRDCGRSALRSSQVPTSEPRHDPLHSKQSVTRR